MKKEKIRVILHAIELIVQEIANYISNHIQNEKLFFE